MPELAKTEDTLRHIRGALAGAYDKRMALMDAELALATSQERVRELETEVLAFKVERLNARASSAWELLSEGRINKLQHDQRIARVEAELAALRGPVSPA